MDTDSLLNDGIQFASKAVAADEEGKYRVAMFFYVEAAEAVLKATEFNPSLASIRTKALQYIERAEAIRISLDEGTLKSQLSAAQNETQRDIQKVEFILGQAVSEDELGNHDKALPLYTDAVELCLTLSKSVDDNKMKESLTTWARNSLERAEAIKGITHSQGLGRTHVNNSSQGQVNKMANSLGLMRLKSIDKVSHKSKLTSSELEVLRTTSYINKKVYAPWIDSDLKERFAYSIPFSDPDGFLALSPKQKSRFSEWKRPSDLCSDPRMIYAVSSLSIRQTVVSDCSFVASLAISAAYERKFRKQLITGIIYPQNRDGYPVINPCGKYMIKLRINGVARKVIIDDTLPVGNNGQLLCSYSNNSDEFWVSLLEKAYLKVMGGYDFPGSNSNIDLCALTGWIPERASLKSDTNSDSLFNRMFEALARGDVLITVATGVMSDDEADRAGLVPTHAYAVLDIRKIQGQKLLQLKNPWNHLRWKGKFSENDIGSWNLQLEQALNYDRLKAQKNDNGVFWINWESIQRFFDVFYMNWNPKLFKYKFTYHAKWQSSDGPVKDLYNMSNNPQFRLEVNAGDSDALVWILLTRHITRQDDFAVNKEFITVHAYQGGNRIYYPDNPYLEGTKINSPHYLAKMCPSKGTTRYTLVISQYEKHNTILYTLKAYSTVNFHLSPVPDPFSSRKRMTGQWTTASAGGCANNASYSTNPRFRLELIADRPSSLLLKLEANRSFATGIEITNSDRSYRKTSGDYRWGFLAFELENVPAGIYTVIPSTFLPGKSGPFFLEVAASCAFKLQTMAAT